MIKHTPIESEHYIKADKTTELNMDAKIARDKNKNIYCYIAHAIKQLQTIPLYPHCYSKF
jgi:hypothetical protein